MLNKIKNASLAAAMALSMTVLTAGQAQAAAPIINDLMAKGDMPSLAPMLKKVLPGVVNISVKGKKDVQGFSLPDEFRFMFPGMDDSFGPSQPRQQEFRALGSGVIIDAAQGLVVTNNHVIDSADEIKVQLSDGREYDAKLVGKDAHTDLALLKLKEFKNLTQIDLADSDSLEVGDFAVAIGNPYGLGQTVTSGIVSALGRTGLNIENIENFIQTDAAINSGNSGGALVDTKGNLIGINTASFSGDNTYGIGFAVPVKMVREVMNEILRHGKVERGYLGISDDETTALDSETGVRIGYVDPEGPAFGILKVGDLITKVDGYSVQNVRELIDLVSKSKPNTVMNFEIKREGKVKVEKVTLAEDNTSVD